MAVPDNRQALLDAMRSTYDKLARDLARVPAGRAREATLEGHAAGTRMSVADLVAYLIGWQQRVLSWCEDRARGLPGDFPAPGYRWNELGRLARQFYADRAGQDYAALRRQLEQGHARLVALVEQGSDASLYGAPWYERYTQGRMIQLNTAAPYANARARLRRWLKAQGLGG